MQRKKNIAILGSTGSIGTQALDIINQHPERFEANVLTANNNVQLLIEQARKYKPRHVVIANDDHYREVKAALADLDIEIYAGDEALEEVICDPSVDMVLTALVGFAGLKPTVAAIRAGKEVALANKETLVVAGGLIMELCALHKTSLIPVDSEHSAIFQCLVGEKENPIEKIYLTASGGPFRGYSLDQLRNVTPKQALKHPNWEMGAKITIDSASMMNKGLEVIEAKWLFGLEADQIDVIVHPQSIIHSIVQFEDSSMKAQMGLPDMRVPIQYALNYPERIQNDIPRFNFLDYPSLTFEQVDMDVFKNLKLAFQAMAKSGNAPCVLNAANEVTNKLFRQGKISFLEIADLNEAALAQVPYNPQPGLKALFESDLLTRDWVNKEAGTAK